jgi:hypothetical protein
MKNSESESCLEKRVFMKNCGIRVPKGKILSCFLHLFNDVAST